MDERRWWKECVFYQVYPQSFCDSDGDGIGDLGGIIGKLDYLHWLGVGALWICPIYPSPGYDNGYDVSDYEAIDAKYGTMDDFNRLVDEAHKREIRIIIDLVLNHTSEEHPWFRESISRPDGPYRDFYIWRPGSPGGGPPNNWGALFGGPAWTQGPDGQYYLHLFSPQQPDLNWHNPLLRQQLYAMMRRWLDRGVDGFRMDVISLIAKPQEMPDGPVGPTGYCDPRALMAANPLLHTYLREMRREALAGADVVTVGEAAAVSLEQARVLTCPDGSELDMLFQFEHMDLDGGETFKWTDRSIELTGLKTVMDRWQRGLDQQGWNALFWNNHDQPRMISRMGHEGFYREASAKMLATCLHMMKGTPFVFQGEELGMTNMPFTGPEQLRDNESIDAFRFYTQSGAISEEDMMRYIGLKSRDNARTPMQWDSCPGAGFTDSRPWMDINPNHAEINALEQYLRNDSVLAFYRRLIALRQQYPVIVDGSFELYAPDDPHIFAYFRRSGTQTLLVCCNFSDNSRAFPPPRRFLGSGVRQLLGNMENTGYPANGILAPFESVILLKEE